MKLDGVGRLHQQVYRALLGEILGGRLMSGERVPSTRHVASLLKVSRNTALLAYEQLLAEGFITPRSGAAGTVVAPVLPPDGYVARPTRRPGSTRSGHLGAAPTLAAVGDRGTAVARRLRRKAVTSGVLTASSFPRSTQVPPETYECPGAGSLSSNRRRSLLHASLADELIKRRHHCEN